MIKVLDAKLDSIDKKEAQRYLGGADVSDALINECEGYVLAAHELRACYELYDITREDDTLDLGFARVRSVSLGRHLDGCDRAILFACTAGVGIDRLIAKYTRISPARAAVIQALGAAAVESWCDRLCEYFVREYGSKRSRFSCGYGDLPLELQRDIFAALAVTKNIGITLSDDCFMTPTKSVTAIVGIPRVVL